MWNDPCAQALLSASARSWPHGLRRQQHTASALVIIFRLLGMTIGVSSLTTYGAYRAGVLNARLLPAGAGIEAMARVGMEVAARVIGETFLIAALVCLLGLLPVLRLRGGNKMGAGGFSPRL